MQLVLGLFIEWRLRIRRVRLRWRLARRQLFGIDGPCPQSLTLNPTAWRKRMPVAPCNAPCFPLPLTFTLTCARTVNLTFTLPSRSPPRSPSPSPCHPGPGL